MTSALEVRGIVKRFGNHTAVDDISFEVPRGVVFGILGPNGAGKSTMLRMINDIIAADAGEIRILGDHAPGSSSSRHIGYLPEERGLYPKMRVHDMVSFMGELRGLSGTEASARADKWLVRLGLGDWLKNKVQDLSKGMQQKVQFATALIHEPELLILDEPWSGLDPINSEVLRETVEEVRAAGRTVLFSTHQMEQAEKVCDQVCIIARGKKVLDGNLRDIKRASAAEGLVALAFADEAAKHGAEAILADRALVADTRPPRPGDIADCEVKLVDGVAPGKLLAALVGAQIDMRRFEVVVPTLHQIFVSKVGATAAVAARKDDN
ncbi:MAG TPA: ATP-binding cassette domain-containing protein [Kofleriaceae bacterium]|jgi:ABC-2 type transport system ATP-binding protein|nr:ATP-binding cassette domain-containing protein [Kofleriaceae bacterium]